MRCSSQGVQIKSENVNSRRAVSMFRLMLSSRDSSDFYSRYEWKSSTYALYHTSCFTRHPRHLVPRTILAKTNQSISLTGCKYRCRCHLRLSLMGPDAKLWGTERRIIHHDPLWATCNILARAMAAGARRSLIVASCELEGAAPQTKEALCSALLLRQRLKAAERSHFLPTGVVNTKRV